MRHEGIPIAWVKLTKSWSAAQMLALYDEVKRRAIAQDDLPAVQAIWEELQGAPPGPKEVKDWGQTIVAFRIKHGLSMKQFCKLVPIGQQALSKLENGEVKRPVQKEDALRRILWGTKS